jgi:predicted ATPase
MGKRSTDSLPVLPHVTELILTGGPGGGKTTALAILARLLSRSGVRVLTVPEIATLIITRGVDIATISRDDGDANCRFQRELFITHRAYRRRALQRAAAFAPDPTVILYDRSEVDGMAWHDHDCYVAMSAEEGTTMDEIRRSYRGVIHLVTAAIGAEHAYTLHNNAARWESPEEAATRDAAVMSVYKEHPNLIIIDNRSDFADKLDRMLGVCLEMIGRPAQMTIDLSGKPVPLAPVTLDEPQPVPV